MNNIIVRTGIVAGIAYYIYNEYTKKPTPIEQYKDVPVINEDFKPILDPKPGQIEDLINQQNTATTTTTVTVPAYAGSGWADAYTGGGAGGTTTTTSIPVDNYTNDFNPDNPFDASGFNPTIYAGGYADSYAAYS
jgi:hypothetical protein